MRVVDLVGARFVHVTEAALCALLLGGCSGGSDAQAESDTGSESGDEAADGDTGETGGDGDEGGGQDLPPIDPTICAELSFDNQVDDAVCDEIWGRGHEPVLADERELCRRLYVDLLGRLPTPADFAADCEGRSVEAIVDDFMARPDYQRMGQRRWADTFLMTSQLGYYEYLVELDAFVGQLYAGDRSLNDFAELAATHPGFTGRFDGQDLVGYSFQAFLGRDAAPHERIALEPLWHMLEERYEETHPVYFFDYTRGVVNTILCMGNSEGNCHSDLWGHHSVVLPAPVEDDYDYNGPNVFAVEDLTSDQWNILRLPGRLIAMQPTFYEAAAERSLERYLGYEAGPQLPLVRQRLVDMFQDQGGMVRPIEREILTSVLYTMSHRVEADPALGPDEGQPSFWHGPYKQLSAEAWLDSIGALAEFPIGSCDHRFPDVDGGRPTPDADYMETVYHPSSYPLDPDWPEGSLRPDYSYRDLANLLGGCPSQQGQVRFTGTGVMIAVAQDAISQAVCAAQEEGTPLLPANFDPADASAGALTAIANHLVERATLRPPDEEAQTGIADAVAGCMADAECDPAIFAFHICTATLKTGPVVFQ